MRSRWCFSFKSCESIFISEAWLATPVFELSDEPSAVHVLVEQLIVKSLQSHVLVLFLADSALLNRINHACVSLNAFHHGIERFEVRWVLGELRIGVLTKFHDVGAGNFLILTFYSQVELCAHGLVSKHCIEFDQVLLFGQFGCWVVEWVWDFSHLYVVANFISYI